MVVGCAGAGKTTLARKLAAASGLPFIHLDFYYWRRGWQLPDGADWREQVVALAAAPGWIMDGNYSNTYDIRMPRADTLIWARLRPRGLPAPCAAAHAHRLRPNATGPAAIVPGAVRRRVPSLRLEFSGKASAAER